MEQSVAAADLEIFKYMKPKWADKLCATGLIRIGTLYDYRRTEHLAAVADAGEGQDPMVLSYTGVVPAAERQPGIIRQIFSNAEGLQLDRVAFEAPRNSDDCYVLSVGLEYSDRTLAEFGGACVRIRGFSKFAGLIHKAIWKHHRGGILEQAFGMCAYREKGREYSEHDFNIHPAWIKNQDYAWQNEARVLWRMKDASALIPLNLTIPRLAKHCKRIR
jgi:hypothetical protein